MLSKNNWKELIRQQEPKKQRFTIKKLTIGVASVLIGFTFMGMSASANGQTTPTTGTPAGKNQNASLPMEKQSNNSANPSVQPAQSGTDSKAITADNGQPSNVITADNGQPSNAITADNGQPSNAITADNGQPSNAQNKQSNVDLSLWKWQTADSTKGYNGIKLTGYTGDVDETATIYVPNNVDFIKAGKIKAGQSVYLGDLSYIRNCRRLIIDNHDGGKVIFVGNPTGSIPTFESEYLEYIDVSGADTHLLTDMSRMFYGSPNLKRIVGLENFDTSHVQSFELMFGWDPQLMDIGDLSKWDVSKVENFNEMFQLDKNLTNIGNLDNWDV
ncbi:BspA family leucine-rich repeat surface protein, partial [Limosilactobacillus reuteri]|uniref:BspA family leucine-rich repeat surface protein n=1 Tax=Limosilactobacillus reuteri TaxID=1598 RepID=UPI00117AEE5B